jgi:cation diffusion facilitator CzcD-associated flavoprotein CzcO
VTSSTRLRELEHQVRRELDLTAYPRRVWPRRCEADGEEVRDVLIVGAGQAGLTVAFALRRRGIPNTLLVDHAPEGSEGPWTTYAAMHTLRTPKHLTGPDQGVPSLTPEAWYRAAHGDDAWERLAFIPREHWQDYLRWFRRVTEPNVWNDTLVTRIEPAEPWLRVQCGDRGVLARRVVLATGMAGNGRWTVPKVIADHLPADRYVHTGAPVDFRRYAGRRVGVLGGGASAFDYAASALEHGASSVDLFYRRREVPRVNPFRWMEFYAFGAHYPELPDLDKWRFTVQFVRTNQPPPQQSWYRCTAWDNFAWHTNAGWDHVGMDGGEVVVSAGGRPYRFDDVISATGPNVELSARPELALLAPEVATWRDRFVPPVGWEDDALLESPYLGPGFEFTEREPGAATWVRRVYDFTFGARLSMGLTGNMNSGLGAGGRRLADAISCSLFLEDRAAFYESYCSYDEAELVDLGGPPSSPERDEGVA